MFVVGGVPPGGYQLRVVLWRVRVPLPRELLQDLHMGRRLLGLSGSPPRLIGVMWSMVSAGCPQRAQFGFCWRMFFRICRHAWPRFRGFGMVCPSGVWVYKRPTRFRIGPADTFSS